MTVTITQEQANAIDEYTHNGGKDMVLRVALDPYNRFILDCACLNELTVEQLARALYVGYTVEKTQEEREADVKEYYDALAFTSERYAVKDTLDFLGIHIEGVTQR